MTFTSLFNQSDYIPHIIHHPFKRSPGIKLELAIKSGQDAHINTHYHSLEMRRGWNEKLGREEGVRVIRGTWSQWKDECEWSW